MEFSQSDDNEEVTLSKFESMLKTNRDGCEDADYDLIQEDDTFNFVDLIYGM